VAAYKGASEIYGPKFRQNNGGAACGRRVQKLEALPPLSMLNTPLTYAAAVGVDIANLLISQPDTGESALEIVDQLVRSAAVDIVVIDSVAALVPRAEIEGEMGDAHVGLQARLMSQALRKITGNIGKSGCTVIFINQLRQKSASPTA